MSKLLSSRKIVVAALLGTGLLGGGVAGVAFAYPATTPLYVSATAAPSTDPAHPNMVAVMVTVSNANPGCSTSIEVQGVNPPVGDLLSAGPTMETDTLYLPGDSIGRYRIKARTYQCQKGQKEHADSPFVVLNAQTTGSPSPASPGDTYRADLTGFSPGTEATVTATLVNSNPLVQVSDSDTVNSKGVAKVHFTFPKYLPGTKTPATGIYTISTTVSPPGPTSASYSVTVS